MSRSITRLKNHYIVCGYGQIGSLIANELKKSDIDSVIIEKDHTLAEMIESDGHLFMMGDATLEEVLVKAGIMRAKGLVTAIENDANNVFIVLTARGLNPNIYILSRATELSSESKLKRAGATKVVLPYLIGGHRMAQALIRPNVVDFIDVAMVDSDLGLQMGEAEVGAHSTVVGKNLIESNLRQDFGIIIVAIRKINGEMNFNPTSNVVIEAKDVIVMLGKKKDLIRLKRVL